MNCTDMGIQMNFLTEACIANATAERPFFMMHCPHMLVHWALVGSAVLTERANKRLVHFMNIFYVSFKVNLLGKVGPTGLADMWPVFNSPWFCYSPWRGHWSYRGSPWWVTSIVSWVVVSVRSSFIAFSTMHCSDVLQNVSFTWCRVVTDVTTRIRSSWRLWRYSYNLQK
jgi:hypothetical protein